MGKKLICEKACKYVLVDGRLITYEGKVYESSNGHRHFVTLGNYHISCPRTPATVVHNSLWLPIRDDNFAKRLLIETKLHYIDTLSKRISKEIELVNILRQES
jgi:hypothetical protein